MISLGTAHRATLTEPLGNDEVRLVAMPYQRAQGRQPLRQLLATHLQVQPQTLDFIEDVSGKPRLIESAVQRLQFNWSHSGGQALIALAIGVEPGIDLERYRPRPRALDIAERYFAADEHKLLEQTTPDRQSEVFLRLWTAKEALLKSLGRGLAFGLDRLSVRVHDDGSLNLVRFETQNVKDWQLHALKVDDGHVGALAWRGGARRITIVDQVA